MGVGLNKINRSLTNLQVSNKACFEPSIYLKGGVLKSKNQLRVTFELKIPHDLLT